jgi:P-type Cu2+ transporter
LSMSGSSFLVAVNALLLKRARLPQPVPTAGVPDAPPRLAAQRKAAA